MKTKRAQPAPYPELRGSLSTIRYPAFIEPKRDGEFNLAISDGSKVSLVNKGGLERTDGYITNILFSLGKSFTLLGELCYHEGLNGDLYRLLANKKTDSAIVYHVFDIADLDGKDVKNKQLIERKELLIDLFKRFSSPYVRLNPTYVCKSKDELMDRHKIICEAGFEGSVTKNIDGRLNFGPIGWAKEKVTDITSFKVSYIDPAADRIEVLVQSVNDNGVTCKACGVKVGQSDKLKIRVGDYVDIKHMGILSEGGLRHPVYKGRTHATT